MPRPPDNPELEDDDLDDLEAPTIQVDTMFPEGVPGEYVAPPAVETVVTADSDGPAPEADEPEDSTQIAPMAMPETVVEAPVETVSTSRGPRIGRYTLRKRLGVGGMAEVFLAEQDGPAGFRKQVVVKRILPNLTASPKFIELFLREARLAATLNHSNIVQIYELGEDEGQYFIAMEYVDGATLHQLAKICWHFHKPLPFELIVGPVADAALGLHHAHSLRDSDGHPAGMVHRDISPDNLMINRDGVTKILDFGVAKGLAATDGSTRVGELKGKIPFMAPEVIQGKSLDGRADLYALGVCMYWLLTGHRPHTADNDAELLDAVLKVQPRSPRELNPTVPVEIDAVVMSLLAKDREQRPQSGEALHDILAELLPAPHRMIAPFVKQVLAWGADLAAGKKPGERPRTFVPAGPSSLYQAGAPGIPGVGIARPVVTPSSLSPSPISDLKEALAAVQQAPAPAATQPQLARSTIDAELAAQLEGEGLSLDELAADAGMANHAVSTVPLMPSAGLGASTFEPNTAPSLPAQAISDATTAPAMPAVEPQDIGALLADTLDELGGSTRSVLTGPMDLPALDFGSAAPPSSDFASPMPLTTGEQVSPLRRARTWFAIGAVLGLGVVAAIWYLGQRERGSGDGTGGPAVLVLTSDRRDAATDATAGGIEFDPGQLGDAAAAAVASPVDAGSVATASVDAGAVAGDAGAAGQAIDAGPGAVAADAGLAGRPVDAGKAEPATPVKVQGRFVQVRAPKHIRWLDHRQKAAGRGNDRLHLPRSATHVYAVDTRRQATTRIPLRGDESIDYTSLPRGKLAVRAFPFAVVSLGKEKVGTTPFAPIDLVAGSYKVTLQHEQTTKVMTVEVKAGDTTTLKANMTEP